MKGKFYWFKMKAIDSKRPTGRSSGRSRASGPIRPNHALRNHPLLWTPILSLLYLNLLPNLLVHIFLFPTHESSSTSQHPPRSIPACFFLHGSMQQATTCLPPSHSWGYSSPSMCCPPSSMGCCGQHGAQMGAAGWDAMTGEAHN